MDYLEYPFIPSIECDAISNPFLPAHPEVLKKTASPVPIISGLSDMEGIIILGGKQTLIYLPNKVSLRFLRPQNLLISEFFKIK